MLAALGVAALVSQVAAPELPLSVLAAPDCPISNRYAPEIQRLAAKFKSKVHFVLVYPVPGDSPEMIAEHKKKFAFAMDSVRDADLKLMKLTGATVTPEVAVMNGSLLLY